MKFFYPHVKIMRITMMKQMKSVHTSVKVSLLDEYLTFTFQTLRRH